MELIWNVDSLIDYETNLNIALMLMAVLNTAAEARISTGVNKQAIFYNVFIE